MSGKLISACLPHKGFRQRSNRDLMGSKFLSFSTRREGCVWTGGER